MVVRPGLYDAEKKCAHLPDDCCKLHAEIDMHIDLGPQDEISPVGLFVLGNCHVTDAYVRWLNDPIVNRYLESRFISHTVESTKAYVEEIAASRNNLFLGIRSRNLGKHVGNIKIGPIDRHHGTSEVGILIGEREAWGSGIATLVIRMVSEIARTRLMLRKLTAGCYVSNVGSRRAFDKAGFAIEGVQRHQCLLDGKPEDLILMGRHLA
jgi:ribosomal-protein-alanine N-acetyltransferase